MLCISPAVIACAWARIHPSGFNDDGCIGMEHGDSHDQPLMGIRHHKAQLLSPLPQNSHLRWSNQLTLTISTTNAENHSWQAEKTNKNRHSQGFPKQWWGPLTSKHFRIMLRPGRRRA